MKGIIFTMQNTFINFPNIYRWTLLLFTIGLLFKLGVCMGRVGSGWGDILAWWVKKNSTQPNPTHHISPTQLTWVGLGQVEPMDLTNFFIIIIKLSKNIYKY